MWTPTWQQPSPALMPSSAVTATPIRPSRRRILATYKYLPTIIADPDGKPVVITHAYRYNNTLGEVVLGSALKPAAATKSSARPDATSR